MSSSFDHALRALAAAFVFAAVAFALLAQRPSDVIAPQPVTLAMIHGFLGQTNNSSPNRNYTHWEDRLAEELKAVPDVRRAAERLAPEFGLSVHDAEQLINAWVHWLNGEHARSAPGYERPASGYVAADLYALVRESNYDPHVIKLAAPIVEEEDRCSKGTLGRLTDGAPNKREAVWAAASTSWYCADWWLALNEMEPMNDAVLLGTVESAIPIRPSQAIAILEHIARDSAQFNLNEPQATALQIFLSRRYLSGLFDVGLAREAVAYFQELPDRVQRGLLDEESPRTVVRLGDHEIALNENNGILAFFYPYPLEFRLEISAALYVSGRTVEARRLFKTIARPGSAGAFERCGHIIGEPRRRVCSKDEVGPIRWRLLEFALERPNDDAYEFVESQFGGGSADAVGTGLWIEVSLKRLVEYRDPVRERASFWNGDKAWSVDNVPVWDLLGKTFDATLKSRANEISREIATVQSSFPRQDGRPRGHGDQFPSEARGIYRFRRIGLPNDCPAPKYDTKWTTPAVPASINRISDVEQFWRVNTVGSLVVVVGQMWSSDIWEEEGLGGVWIHISQDGGKTWEKPLFTGLESNPRFMVRVDPCVSRLDGDHLVLEYWLVGNVEHDAKGKEHVEIQGPSDDRFAIDIPLSTLRRDSDGDGLTDIVEESLLLNPHSRDSDGDGIPDGEDPFPNVGNKLSNDFAGPMAEVLKGVVDGPARGREQATIHASMGTQKMSLRATERPLILFATDPRLFAGISADRMVLVFTAKDLSRLDGVRSQVSGTSFEAPVVNRSRDRGYIKYDNGLTGGTIAWRREGGGWKAAEISSFIR